jgi:hypothetical protein
MSKNDLLSLPDVSVKKSKVIEYEKCKNSPPLNTLLKFNDSNFNNKKNIDKYTGKVTFIKNRLTVAIENYLTNPTNFDFQTHRYLQFIHIKFTKDGKRIVEFPVAEYMEMCGLHTQQKCIDQIKKIFLSLKRVSISYSAKTISNKKKKNNWNESFGEARLVGDFYYDKGIVYHELTNTLHKHFETSPLMSFPTFLLKIDARKNPHSFYFGAKIVEQRNMNNGKPNQNIITLKTLINSSPYFPTKDKVGKRFSQLMKEPFERDMDHLAPGIKWHYCNRKKEELKQKDIKDYKTWIELSIYFELKDYPVIKKKPIQTKNKKVKI